MEVPVYLNLTLSEENMLLHLKPPHICAFVILIQTGSRSL